MRNFSMTPRAFKASLLTSIFTIFTLILSAQTVYVGPTNGSWFTAANWSNGLPAPGNNALIPGGGINVNIAAALTVNFTIDNFSSITATAAITIPAAGNLSNSGNLNLNGTASIGNAGTFNNFGTAVFAATANFTNQAGGNFTNGGAFTLPGTLNNAGSVTNNGTLNANNGLVQTSGSFSNNQTMSVRSLTISAGSNFLNNFGANLTISGAGAALDCPGTLTNNGTVNLAGAGNLTGVLGNNVQFNIQTGGSLTVAAAGRIDNGGTILNQATFTNNGVVNNSNNFFNEGTAVNNKTFTQNNRFENRLTGAFTNEIGSTLSMGFGTVLLNAGNFLNKTDIQSFGTITNDGTFSNAGTLTSNSGATLDNNKTFNNTGTVTSFNTFTNDDTFNNDNRVNVGSGSVLTNTKNFNNNPGATLRNEFEIRNVGATAVFTNRGKIENLVRFFVDGGSLLNQAYFENTGDVFTATGTTLNNSGLFFQAAGNVKNAGTLTNSGTFDSDDCSTIVNTGTLNNTASFKFKAILFQRGTLTGTALTNNGGYIHTALTSSAPTVCANRTISADVNGVVKAYATSLIAFANFDSCQNIIYRANGIARPTFTCADIGTVKNMNVVLTTRLGDSLTCVSQVTPADLLEPKFSNCPTEIFVQTPNNTANVTWTVPTAADNCTAVPTVTTTNAPGSSFPVGITAVTYSATDARPNTGVCQFRVNVVKTGGTSNCVGDVTAPTISNCPTTQNVATDGNNAVVSWLAPTAADACAPVSISPNFLPGTTFGLGNTTVVYTARDGNGNSATCSFLVKVFKNNNCLVDTQKPVFQNCPANIYLPTNANLNGALATWTAPSVSDNCAVASQTQSHFSGTVFPIGSTTVSYTATDGSNNTGTCTFSITVGADPCPGDLAGPAIANCPTSQTKTITLGSSDVATWTAPTATDACTPVNLTSNFSPGATFPIGVTTVRYQASDRKGNTSVCTFNIIVQTACSVDAVPPTISGCPANLTVGTTGTSAAATWTAPVATDACGIASFSASYAPGATFPVGTTQVAYTAADFRGNTATCVFNVVVTNAPACATNASPINNATAQATATLNLTWNVAANATAYDVFLDIVNPPTKLVAPNVVGNSLTINNLNGGTDYWWYVVAKNSAGSAASCAANATKFTTSGTPQGGGTYTINNALPICKGPSGQGLTVQTWTGITGSALTNLTTNAAYPNSPNSTTIFNASKSTWNQGDNYGTRVRGFVTPTVSGNYTFTITGDDQTSLWFSATGNPANMTQIATIADWTNETEFTKYASQRSAAISMIAGQPYYLELLQKEGTGGDGWGIWWTAPGTTTTVQIPLANLSPITNDCPVSTTATGAASRVSNGLVVLYDFKEGSGATVNDVSGNGTPLNLTIQNTANVTRLAGSCGLRINTATSIRPNAGVSSSKISTACSATNEITIEAWVRPTNITQTGPARIATFSESTVNRNFTLGQTAADYVGRLRTTATDANGIPEVLAVGGATTNLQHVVYTRNAAGIETIYVDNELYYEGTRTGTFNWNAAYTFILGNELTNDRPWLGEMHLVAVYSRALSISEIGQNYHVGVCSTVNNNVCNQNLMANGSFEKDLFGWAASNGANITTTAGNFSAGTRGAQMCATANGQVYEIARATAGATYTFTVRARRSVTGATGTVNMNFTNSAGTQLGSVVSQSVNSNAFTTYTLTGVAPANTYWVNVWVTQTNTTGCIYADEVCVTDGSVCAATLRVANSATCTVKLYSVSGSTETFVADVNAATTRVQPSSSGQIWRIRRASDGFLVREYAMSGCNDQTVTVTACGGTVGSTGGGCAGDVTLPTISGCPTNQTLNTTTASATATWTAPTATDNCGSPLLTSNYLPGATFPLGATAVRYTAFDTRANTATCQFTITVNNACATDATPPVFAGCPANISLTTSQVTVVANWTAPTASDNCSTPAVTSNFLPGQSFAPGTTTVRYTAVDARGNSAVCQFNVVITSTNPCANDLTAPTIAGCPTNINFEIPGGTGGTVSWNSPIPNDNCGVPNFETNHIPGEFFPLGNTTVLYRATDVSGNSATCQFVITVVINPCLTETTPPIIANCPVNQTLTTTGTTQTATWTPPTATDNCPGIVNLTTTHAPGSSFPVGATNVRYTATDVRGNSASCNFTITVNNPCLTETTPPVISNCPVNQTLTTTGTTQTATWTPPTATDNCPGTVNLISNFAPGASFPIGVTTVTYTATDVRGNTAVCNFTITVNNPCLTETTPPVIANCPVNQSLTTNGTSATATWTAPTATDNCPGIVNLTSTHLPGATFPLGATNVRYTATDVRGNTATCNFTITVSQNDPCLTETTPPVIANCPVNQSLTTNGTSATATWTAPTATDNCPGTVNLTTTHLPGATFPLGATNVRYTATDVRGNTATCNFTITVSQNDPCLTETTPPTLVNCPVNLTVATTGTSAPATWTPPTATDNCPGIVNVSGSHAPGSSFAVGTTAVTYTATDVRGNTSTCAFTVTINQTDPCLTEVFPPTISGCPANITVTTTGTTAPATWTEPTATDNCPGTITWVKSHLPGDVFTSGTTTVTYTARDVRNNASTCTFTVTVTPSNNNLDCNNIQITSSGSSIVVSGLTAPIILVQVFDPTWAQVFNCVGNCNVPTQSINGLAAGTYFVKVDFLDATWTGVCKKEQFITVTGGGGTGVLTFPQPADITVTAPVNQNSMTVNYSTPTATSTCASGAVSVVRTSGPASGTLFPIGTTQICFTASDGCGNTQSRCFNVVVNPGGGGTGNCNAITFTPTGGTLTVGNLVAPITMLQVFNSSWAQLFTCAGNCTSPTQTVEGLASGTYFVKATLLDATWTAICSKEEFVVVGAGGPVLSFPTPPNITVTAAPNATTANVTYSLPTASTTCVPNTVNVSRTSGLASGSDFPVGTTQVCWLASDGCGNTKTACFNVVVNANTGGGTDCNAISITPGAGNIVVGNLTAPVVLVQAFDANWGQVFNCVGNCPSPTTTISGLAPGQYFVKVDFLDASWTPICKKEQFVTVNSNLLSQDKGLIFNAFKNGNSADLKWISSSGEQNDYFVIERNTTLDADGSLQDDKWVPILMTDGKGLKNEVLTFAKTDDAPLDGLNFYRLKLVFRDGSSTYSQIEKLNFPRLSEVSVFPNPADERFFVNLSPVSGEEVSLGLFGLDGRLVQNWTLSAGRELFEVETSGLGSGVYFLKVGVAGQRGLNFKVVVAR